MQTARAGDPTGISSGAQPAVPPSGRRRFAVSRGQRAVRAAGLFGTSLGDVAALLHDQHFRWLWLSTFAWNFARWMELTVTGWVALEMTGSPWLVAVVGLCRTAFLPIAGPITGALSDRFDRVRLMRTAQWGNVLCIGAVATALLTGHGAYWQLIVLSLWLGASWGIDWPSRRALMADLVGPTAVLQGMVLDNVTQNVSRVAGPLLAGVLLAYWGSASTFAVLAASFLVASLTLTAVTSVAPEAHGEAPATPAASVWRELGAGLSYVRHDPAMWAVLLITVVMNCLHFPYQQMLSVFAEQVLEVGPIGLGAMGAANGIGATVGLLLLPSFRGPRWQFRAFVGGALLGSIALLAFTQTQLFPIALLLLLVTGLGTSGFSTMQSTIILSRARSEMRGRAMGLVAFAIGTAPLGQLETGLVAERWGAPLAIAINAALGAALITWIAWRTLAARTPVPTAAPVPDRR